MGIEESMIEDGFHDEEEYLEYLLDEADREFERQRYRQSLYNDDAVEPDDNYIKPDYNKLQGEFRRWIRANPIMHKVFLVWLFYYTERDSQNKNYVLDKFLEWQENEVLQLIKLHQFYGDTTYSRIIKCSDWERDNLIEEILMRPHFSFFYPNDSNLSHDDIPTTELLVSELKKIEEWIENKEKYDLWYSAASEESRIKYVQPILWNELNAGNEIYMRECILKQLEEDDEPEYLKEQVINWFDLDNKRARDLLLYVKCVQLFQA